MLQDDPRIDRGHGRKHMVVGHPIWTKMTFDYGIRMVAPVTNFTHVSASVRRMYGHSDCLLYFSVACSDKHARLINLSLHVFWASPEIRSSEMKMQRLLL